MAVWIDPDQEQEAIWDLKYHPFQDLLLSLNANNSIILWDCSSIDSSPASDAPNKNGIIRHRFEFETAEKDNATSVAWLQTQ